MKVATKSIKLTALASGVLAAGLVMSTGAFALDTAVLTVSAKISGVCKVTTAPGTLDFGTIDPSGGSTANATAATFTMKCSNGTAATGATDGGTTGGLYAGGGFKRMQHTIAGNFLPYAITYSGDTFTGGGFGGAAATVTINGTISSTNYAGALAGNYSDTVTITVNP
jgi:spore coat protein U-like protein